MRILISDDIKLLTGKGIEYLVDQNGDVIAVFYDGNFQKAAIVNQDDTAIAA